MGLIHIGLVASALAARLGLRALLEKDPDLVVGVEAASPAALALQLEVNKQPAMEVPGLLDVFILFGDDLWREAAREFGDAWPAPAVLVLLRSPDLAQDLPQLALRAWGLLPEDAGGEELIAAVHGLYQGLVVVHPEMFAELNNATSLEGLPQGEVLGEDLLTEREIEVLQLLAQGLANKQIAQELSISAHTVKFHVSSIYSKLGAGNRTEAVRLGLQNGLIVL